MWPCRRLYNASASSTISGVALGCLSARPSRGLPAASDLPTATTPCGRAGAAPHGARLGWPGQDSASPSRNDAAPVGRAPRPRACGRPRVRVRSGARRRALDGRCANPGSRGPPGTPRVCRAWQVGGLCLVGERSPGELGASQPAGA